MNKMISVVIPIYNEGKTVVELHTRLIEALKTIGKDYEIIFIDDGSQDNTFTVLKTLSPITIIRLRRNYGQTIALAAGIHEAKGDVIITMDSDLENDPADIPLLLQKIEAGYDIVSGWRRGRWEDQRLSRRLPSFLANTLISYLTGIKLHDHGCTLKAYRHSTLEKLSFSGDMHRMLAAYGAQSGARVVEIPVRFTKRRFGTSHYGISRTFKVLFDIIAFYFFRKYYNRPMHFFGTMGFGAFFLGIITFVGMLYLKFFEAKSFITTPLPILTILFFIIGFQFILFGLLAEMNYRLLREERHGNLYDIEEKCKQ